MRVVNSCCKCISLRIGTIIIGSIGCCWNLIVIILVASIRTDFTDFGKSLSPRDGKILSAISSAIGLVASILLLIGAIKRIIWYILPWLILTVIMFATMIVTIILSAVYYHDIGNVTICVVTILAGLGALALGIYFWLVVLSYYETLRLQLEE